MADTLPDEFFHRAAARLAEASRAAAIPLPAADVRQLGRRRRRLRAAAASGSAAVVIGAFVAGTYASGVLSAGRSSTPAQQPEIAQVVDDVPPRFLPLQELSAVIAPGSWEVKSTVLAAKATSASGCNAAAAAVTGGGSGTAVIYTNGPVGLTEMVATYADDEAATSGFKQAALTLSRCTTALAIGDSRNYRSGEPTTSTSLAFVQRHARTEGDAGRASLFSLRRQGSVVVLLQRDEFVDAAWTPASDEPLQTAMTRAMTFATH